MKRLRHLFGLAERILIQVIAHDHAISQVGYCPTLGALHEVISRSESDFLVTIYKRSLLLSL
jgi:hypothetical protein